MTAPIALEVDAVGKRFGRRWVVDGVSFRAEAGRATAIVGANGAGKSTLLSMCAGVLEPDRGAIAIGGDSIVGRRVAARRRLGYVPEAANPPGHLTGDELLQLVATLKQALPLPPPLRQGLGLDDIGHVPIGIMSLGQRRRTCLGAALIGEPTVLLLDEPSNGLDAAGVDTLVATLLDRLASGVAVVVATHDRALIERLGASTVRLEAGRVAS